MRTIKFRGKRLDNGEWIFGDLLQTNEGSVCIGIHGQYIDDGMHFNDLYDETPYIDEDTLGQFTGLLDKNGKEIYEGDIVRYQDTMGYSFIGLIGFDEGRFGFVNRRGIGTLDKDGVYADGYCSVPYTIEYEVLGNIHDNPELLNEK